MSKETAIVNDLMSKYGLTDKDLFSFCICAVNFLEYYQEEGMYDVMWSCPERYSRADSNNTKAVAGALTGEKKAKKWTDVDQFTNYMRTIQESVSMDADNGNMEFFFREFNRFDKVYRREVMVPIMLGCPVEDYDDTQFDDVDYLESIVNVDNLSIYNAYEEEQEAKHKKFLEEQEAELAKEIEEKKNDKDFTVFFASCMDITILKKKYEEYNKKYYPDRDYKVISMHRPNQMIIQTGGKSIEEVKDTIIRIFKQSLTLLFVGGHEMQVKLVPVEKVYSTIPSILKDNNVTYVIAYY